MRSTLAQPFFKSMPPYILKILQQQCQSLHRPETKRVYGEAQVYHTMTFWEKNSLSSHCLARKIKWNTQTLVLPFTIYPQGPQIMLLNWLVQYIRLMLTKCLLAALCKAAGFSHFRCLSPSNRTANHDHDSEPTSLPTSFDQPQLHQTRQPSSQHPLLNVPAFSSGHFRQDLQEYGEANLNNIA